MNDLSASTDPVLVAEQLQKRYQQADAEIVVLDGLCLQLLAGERVAIVGRSGSGKSTLLHILAGLDFVDSGEVNVAGKTMSGANPDQRAALRGQHMGFVYQNHHLLPEFSALENVAMPILIAGGAKADAHAQAKQLLTEVGLSDRATHLPSELSGGERQRVAVARALAGQPSVVLADEPTGNLDRDNAAQVMDLIAELSQQRHTAFIVVTHDVGMLEAFDRVLKLEDGRLLPYAE